MLCVRAGDTGRPDTEAYPRLYSLDGRVDIANHLVDVRAAPVFDAEFAAAVGIGFVLGGILRVYPLGIEVVVEKKTVDIIVADNLGDDITDALADLGKSRVEV